MATENYMNLLSFLDISLETANNFYSWGWKASLLGATVTLIGVSLLMWGTRVRDHDFEANISQLNSDASKAHERAAQLENDAAKAKEKTATLEVEAAKNKESVARLNERTAQAEARTVEAQLELNRIKENQAPWVFSADQKKKLIESLKKAPKGKIEVSYIISDGDRVSGMARYIEEAFRTNGYTMGPEIGMISNPSNPKGIQVVFISEEDEGRAKAYTEIFHSIGIPSTMTKRDLSRNTQDSRFLNPVEIRVFCKP
jgi:hypothetical protein